MEMGIGRRSAERTGRGKEEIEEPINYEAGRGIHAIAASSRPGLLELFLAHDDLVSPLARRDDLRLDSKHFFYSLDVPARFDRKRRQVCCAKGALPPSRDFLIHRYALLENAHIFGEVIDRAAVVAIADADLQSVEAIQYIELRERKAGETVDTKRVLQDDHIEPAASPRPACGGAELAALLAYPFSESVCNFRGEGAFSDPRGVRFDDAEDPADLRWTDSQSGAGTSGYGV